MYYVPKNHWSFHYRHIEMGTINDMVVSRIKWKIYYVVQFIKHEHTCNNGGHLYSP
jgi:hypothetical protein